MAKILVADDEVSLVMILKDELEEMGHKIFTAHSGAEALRIAGKKKPDLIILDISLPDMDGFDICGKLKLDNKTESIPILMCTGKDMVGDVEKGFKLGIAGYVIKPIDLERIKVKINNILGGKTA
ncbi:MAG: response regulator [Elusimicrobia bacterium]|nr:response regulator [Elusimicrobiota bacterium]